MSKKKRRVLAPFVTPWDSLPESQMTPPSGLLRCGSMLATFVAALAYAGFAVLAVTIMSTSVSIARKRGVRPEQVYGVLLGSMYLACLTVTVLGDVWLFRLDTSTDTAIAVVSVLTLYVLALSLFAIHGVFGKKDTEVPEEPLFDSSPMSDDLLERCSLLSA